MLNYILTDSMRNRHACIVIYTCTAKIELHMYWLVQLQGCKLYLIGHTWCYDCMITYLNQISHLISCIRCAKMDWKPKMISLKYYSAALNIY